MTIVNQPLVLAPRVRSFGTQMTADGLPPTARRYAGGSVSVTLHLALALVLLYRFHPIGSSPSRPETISLLDLGQTGAGRDLKAQADIVLDRQSEAEPDVAKPKVELDVSKALEPSPAWPVSEPGAPQPHLPAASAGGPSYDPYAGSAPYQQGEASYRLSVTSGSGIGATTAPAESQPARFYRPRPGVRGQYTH